MLGGKDNGCCLKCHPELGVGHFWWCFEWVVEPFPEISIGKQVQSKQGHQSTESQIAFGAKLKIIKNQHGNQCCPNLRLQSVGTGADEGLDL